ncbi:ATPase, T2SS/T4P/T4SS family [Paraburkholderia tagetis]|uniref:Flp pilus assembly complex ATPase component TadA n=1 Tax=Paraburkholderia tagetis TaxID=2913261 RepID=A0A9X1UI73_9BURK|nr:ATPase, T2SS/T4P/T4SS family [Paraburkholderia tagetis]MCG5077125.1 Flp pilus assembly complex ATPase component TadA [Paraburkholderia tagetis]
MSLFGNLESNEKPRSGVMARLRAWRGGFVEDSESAVPIEPVLGATRPVRKGPGAPAGSLGAYLRDAEVTDVDASDVKSFEAAAGAAVHRPAAHGAATETPTPVEDVEGRIVQPSTTVSHGVGREDVGDVWRSADEGDRDTTHGNAVNEEAMPFDEPRDGADSEALNGDACDDARDEPQPAEATGHAVAVPDIEYTPVGMPKLSSVHALADFKRILCDTTPEATLRITPEARRDFVAVDMQAGMAVVIATREFQETALYATYLSDLERAHISVREEMVATAAVIADVYDRARIRVSNHVPEGSRAIAFFRDVYEAAQGYDASDVHWESRDYQSDAEVRFRVDGDLYTYRRMPKATVLRALSAAYQDLVQRNTNSGNAFQPSAPQSAMIPLALATATLNLRWQSAPQMGGFDVAMRILDGNFRNYTVRMPETMGLEASQLAIINSLGHVSGGAVLLSGETGSAKSTLLRALSYMVDGRELKKQYAVSMPSEYPMPWLSDQSVPRGLDETEEDFRRKVATIIRTLMRMDPDDLTVAEILDSTIAGLVVELALTGHPVRTTIHADSIIGVFMRLMGDRLRLAADEVASDKFINAVGNQKLIPMLCPDCKKAAADVMSPASLELLRSKFGLDTSEMACRNDDGCETCRKKGLFTRDGKVAGGTKGQTLAMELYRPTPEFLEHIVVRDWRGAEAAWRKERVAGFDSADMTGKTIYEHALYKASQGLIDPRFIDRSMKSFSVYNVLPDRDGRLPS